MIAACGQMQATTMDQAAEVWPAVAQLAAVAAKGGADLLVLPEVVYPAYYLESRERYLQPDIERSPRVLERLAALAAEHRSWLVAGFVEEQGDRLYNSAAVFNRSGRLVGVARKNFLWDCDLRWFTPGDELSVFETEFGRMGVLICADARVPEISATLAQDGARFVIQPTAWVNTSEVRGAYRNAQPDFLIRARAMEFGVPFICCSKAGREGSALEYVGQSQIVARDGRLLAQAAVDGEQSISAEIATMDQPLRRRSSADFADGKRPIMDTAMRERLLGTQPPYRANQPALPARRLKLRTNPDVIAAQLEAAGTRVGRLAVRALDSFAPARCLALDGVQVVVAAGSITDDALARTRAAENRIFVIVASDSAQLVIDPRGDILWRRVDALDEIDLELAQADIKQFNPTTDLWTHRRVRCYRF